MPRTRLKQWDDLQAEWDGCRACPLHERRVKHPNRKIVFGEGDLSADVLFVGEGPGAQEELNGAPFVGPAGGVLDGMLEEMEYDRKSAVVVNAVCCRACDTFEEDGRTITANKTPSVKMIKACQPRLFEQIYIADPLVIVALGAPALKALAGTKASLSKVMGEVITVTIPGRTPHPTLIEKGKKNIRHEVVHGTLPLKYPVVAVHHPSYLLKMHALEDHSPESLAVKVLLTLEDVVLKNVARYLTIEGGKAS